MLCLLRGVWRWGCGRLWGGGAGGGVVWGWLQAVKVESAVGCWWGGVGGREARKRVGRGGLCEAV